MVGTKSLGSQFNVMFWFKIYKVTIKYYFLPTINTSFDVTWINVTDDHLPKTTCKNIFYHKLKEIIKFFFFLNVVFYVRHQF